MSKALNDRDIRSLKYIDDIIDLVGYANLDSYLNDKDRDVLWRLLTDIERDLKNKIEDLRKVAVQNNYKKEE